jgi:hypothetical protein
MSLSISEAFSKHKTDNLYTPRILIDGAFPHLSQRLEAIRYNKHRKPIVLSPFDTADSEFVKKFYEEGYEVKYGHISTGEDFFTYDYGNWDACISNPPFSKKLEVFKRLNSFRRPWAMIMNVMALNYESMIRYFADNPVEILFFDRRVSFDGNPSSFGSCFVCNDMLMNDIEFEKLPHNNVGKNFVPSSMYSKEELAKCNSKYNNLNIKITKKVRSSTN